MISANAPLPFLPDSSVAATPLVPSAPPSSISTVKYAQVQFDFVKIQPFEISVQKDEVVEVLLDDGEWIKIRSRGSEGFVPRSFLY